MTNFILINLKTYQMDKLLKNIAQKSTPEEIENVNNPINI